jgi:hypothetical protein
MTKSNKDLEVLYQGDVSCVFPVSRLEGGFQAQKKICFKPKRRRISNDGIEHLTI